MPPKGLLDLRRSNERIETELHDRHLQDEPARARDAVGVAALDGALDARLCREGAEPPDGIAEGAPLRDGRTERRAVTIADVVAMAGVSTATVSRALSKPAQLRTGTLARVTAAVQQSGYRPNIAARTLRAGRAMLALVVVPDIANPFFSDVLRGIEDELSRHHYGLLIGNLNNGRAREAQIVDVVRASTFSR